MSKQKRAKRVRVVWFIVYEDSAPSDWRDYLRGLGVEGFTSPLHNSDINEDGSAKKPHYHVIVYFSGVKSLDVVTELFKDIAANGLVQVPIDTVKATEYLCHLNDEDKAYYDPRDVEGLGGLNYMSYISKRSKDKTDGLALLLLYIVRNNCFNFSLLYLELLYTNRELFEILKSSNPTLLMNFIKSFAYFKESFLAGHSSPYEVEQYRRFLSGFLGREVSSEFATSDLFGDSVSLSPHSSFLSDCDAVPVDDEEEDAF